MGAWGSAPWDNDPAADWFAELFEATKLARRVEKTLNRQRDLEEYAPDMRAAAYVLVALGRNYIWPVEDLDRHLTLAIAKLEAIRELADYEGMPEVDDEITLLRSRLQNPTSLGTPAIDEEKINATQALRNLTEALDDRDPEVAEEAALALAEVTERYFREDRGYAGVVRLLKSKREPTRARAVQTAVKLRGESGVDDVLPLLRDRSARVREEVLGALLRVVPDRPLAADKRERFLQAALTGLKDKDATVRGTAAGLLGAVGDPTVLAQLEKARRKERVDRTKERMETAIEAITQRGSA
jgi:HEAT repeat protein